MNKRKQRKIKQSQFKAVIGQNEKYENFLRGLIKKDKVDAVDIIVQFCRYEEACSLLAELNDAYAFRMRYGKAYNEWKDLKRAWGNYAKYLQHYEAFLLCQQQSVLKAWKNNNEKLGWYIGKDALYAWIRPFKTGALNYETVKGQRPEGIPEEVDEREKGEPFEYIAEMPDEMLLKFLLEANAAFSERKLVVYLEKLKSEISARGASHKVLEERAVFTDDYPATEDAKKQIVEYQKEIQHIMEKSRALENRIEKLIG